MAKQEIIDALVGTTIGNYVVQRKVGSGAMGSVYLGEHPEIGKRVAIKVLAGHLTEDACMVERFHIEARAIGLLEHPNIVEMYDFGVLPDGRSYYTMEYLQGETLSQRMKRGNFKVRELYAIVEQICDALYVVHEKGIIHRDMKPSNVFLAKKGMRTVVKILDFGIAKIQESMRKDGELLTSTGAVLGTPVFMSPEQALGQNAEISYLSDIYSLGVILYKILTDRFPIDGTGIPEVVTWHLTKNAIPLRSVNPIIPEPLSQVVMRCLAKNPSDRYESTAHLWEAFSSACAMLDMEWVIPSNIASDVTVSPAQALSLGTASGLNGSDFSSSSSFYPPPPPPDLSSPSYPAFAGYPQLPPESASQSVIAGDSFAGERKNTSSKKLVVFSTAAVLAIAAIALFLWKKSDSKDTVDKTPAPISSVMTSNNTTDSLPTSQRQSETETASTTMLQDATPKPTLKKTYTLHLNVTPSHAQVELRVNDMVRSNVGSQLDFEVEDGSQLRIRAQAEGFVSQEREFIVNEKIGTTLTLELEPLQKTPMIEPIKIRPAMSPVRPISPMKGMDINDKPKDLL